ncbi:hypothetical protein BT96DRAFT_987374 [Gymnopus androsaceus JB14]|uniref:Uncharacterized protein n=1 Tax=Gymnopus androsaceus JB14 TaxID=1447944 RepID=A0A6A4I7G1_9AGAR|nr:hypothetical protein BT96DRAFT_987374 [Gymnopus androsaceus JB14]
MRQGQPAVEAVPMTSSSRLHRSSWAGIMTSKGCGTISRKEGKEVEMRARRACSFSGVHGVREDTGATGATEEPARIHAEDGILGLAFEDPFHRLSTPQQRKPQSQSSQHTGNGSRRLHKRRPISVHNEEGWTNGKETTESKVKNAAKRRSLGSRLWKKFKRLTSF